MAPATEDRRTPAPDIAACILFLVAATFFFSALRAVYSTRAVAEALFSAAGYLGLLAGCAGIGWGLLGRRAWALPAGLCTFAALTVAALSEFHVPETAELPAAVLGVFGAALLLGAHRELSGRAPEAPPAQREEQAGAE